MKQFFFFLFGFFLTVGHAQQAAKVELSFPSLTVDRVSVRLMKATREAFTGKVTMPDGMVYRVKGQIPETYVRGPLANYMIDSCTGTGEVETGSIVMNLPKQALRGKNGLLTALEVEAPTSITLPNGQVGVGTVTFPDCPTSMVYPSHYVGSAITVGGTVYFPDRN